MNPSESLTLLFTLTLGAWFLALTVRLYLRTGPLQFDSPERPKPTPISNVSFRILMVGGICGELLAVRWIGNYMFAMRPALLALFPDSKVGHYQPGRFMTSKEAAEHLAFEIMSADDAEEPLILVGHSKGGLDILELMINHPALIARIRLAVIMNAPLQGSWAADWIVKHLMRPLRLKWRALEELTTSSREQFWSQRWMLLPEWHRRLIFKRLHVVTSEEFLSSQCAWPIVPTHRWMRSEGLRGDGLVTLENQNFPAVALSNSSPLTIHFFWHHGYLTCQATLSSISEIERIETLRTIFAQHLTVLRASVNDSQVKSPGKAVRHNLAHLASRRRYGHLEVIK